MADTHKELERFWKQFSKMIGSGIPIVKSLKTIAEETSSKPLKDVITNIAEQIIQGANLSESVKEYPGYFPPTVLTMIEAGEVAGCLDDMCQKITEGYKDGTFESEGEVILEEIGDGKKEISERSESVIKIVNLILLDAVKRNATDIHIEWLSTGMRIRLRIDGVLKEISPPPKEQQKAVINRLKIMANVDLQEKRLPQDGRVLVNFKGQEIDLRVSFVPYLIGQSVVMRILDRSKIKLDIERIGLSEENLALLRKWMARPNGIILTSGPTGSGTTTLMYSILKELNTEGVKIVTAENPVEYQFDGVNQQQILPHMGLTFARSIRALLRQDPDIVMVGEIRDTETAHLLIQTALTGHLAISNLHTSDAPGVLRRLLDMGLEPFLVNSTIIGSVAQRLVRKVCPDCKEEYTPDEWMQDLAQGLKGRTFYRGKGCKKCMNTGYRGRTTIHELMEMDNDVRKCVSQDGSLNDLRECAVTSGMKSMLDDGIEKAAQGITTLEEVLRVIPVTS